MKKPLLMQSLPNSGSTWFAALLANYIPGCAYYEKEFFNPVCNLRHEQVLQKQFGCELISCYENIAKPGMPGIDDDIRATWGRHEFTFTKECNSAFKLPTFVEHFSCFVFLRNAVNTFPPGRARAWSFYEHAWWALKRAGHAVQQENTMARAVEAHARLERAILEDAERFKLPVIFWENLFIQPRSVVEQLRTVTEVEDGMVEAIERHAHRTARGAWA